MPYKNYKEKSKSSWGRNVPDGEGLTLEEIQIGCLQRIADATEGMSQNYLKLQQEYDYLKGRKEYWQQEVEAARRQVASMKGVVTKLKKKIANGTSQNSSK